MWSPTALGPRNRHRHAAEVLLEVWRHRLDLEVERARDSFQRLAAEYMMERIDALHEAEGRRKQSVPSTPDFHQAARDEMATAAEIWDSARISDEETPKAQTN